MAERQRSFSLLPKIINGGIAGIVGITCVFPLDLVKTRLQNQYIGPRGEKQYNSIMDAMRKTYRSEGLLGMYHGSAVNILLITPEKAIKLAANDMFRYHFKKKDGTLPVFRQVLAGAAAGTCQMIVTTPMELLKIQMQDSGRLAAQQKARGEKVQTSTATKLALEMYRKHGIAGLYKGCAATFARDIPFSMIYFPLFATLNDLGPRKNDGSGEAVFWCSFLAGLGAGSFAGFIVTPLDVMKTRLQTTTKGAGEENYKGISDAFFSILKKEGVTAFFKGGACRVMVIAPLFAIAQVVYYVGVAEYLLGIDKRTH